MHHSADQFTRRSLLRIAGLGLGSFAVMRTAYAHHGWGSYDAAKTITLAGPIKELKYANPHCQVVLDVQGKKWECVLAPPFRMENRGIPDGLMKVGMPVTVIGYASTAHEGEMRAERITVEGKTVELR
ncbi:MAG: hypothetical protein K0S54_741 [Alphaproteobacteria bacterium]|jgi:hypothetical protein|nr:hypothetical protein [Alphaproteobacteria bacterium]